MTRGEAITILDRRTTIPGDGYTFEQINEAIDLAISALRPISRERAGQMRSCWITVSDSAGLREWSKCAFCQEELDGLEDAYDFCPYCGAPMTDEAVQMVMEKLEAMKDGEG